MRVVLRDKAGAPTLIDDRLFGPASYRYDANGQVAQAKFGEALTESFDYDAAKNVVGISVEGPEVGSGIGALLNVHSTPGGVVQLSHGPHGETITLTHDVCGRVIERRVERKGFRPRTWRYGWDVLDRLVSCVTPEGERWFYRYDPFGRRLTKVKQFSDTERAWVAKRHPQLVSQADREGTVLWTWPQAPNGHAVHDPRPPIVGTHFLWDGDVIAEEAPLRLDGSIDWQGATRWHFEPESFVPIAKQMPDGRLAYIVTDHLGTPREMFDEVGHLRWAMSLTTWGVVRRMITPPEPANDDGRRAMYPRGPTRGNIALEPEKNAVPYDCPIRFQGQWEDSETRLYYNHHRYYDSITGNYFGSDPIGLDGGARTHGYVERPTINTDPLGLLSTVETPAAALQRLTNQAVADAAANPAIAKQYLSPGSYRYLVVKGRLTKASYGKYIERRTADLVAQDPVASQMLSYQSRPFISTPDFYGYQGYNMTPCDITTPGGIASHLNRSYGSYTQYITYPNLPSNLVFPP